jgi:hypothetical protein
MLRGTRTSTKCLKSDGRVWRQREENEAGKKRSVNLSKAIQAGKGTTTLSGFQTTTVAPGQTYRRKLEGRKLRNFRLSILQSVRRILALEFGISRKQFRQERERRPCLGFKQRPWHRDKRTGENSREGSYETSDCLFYRVYVGFLLWGSESV